ncbi:MAG: hypothetical protein PHS49_04935 [Candidatus Gracilibacteria bacterium]|nr:hypothetical protein [Candidatus Gracilibacteria bacterium]
MKSKITLIFEEIDKKKYELKQEYLKMKDKYGFHFKGGKIVFNTEKVVENKKYKKSILNSIFNTTIKNILAIPFIYVMIVPAVFLDIFLFVYQQTAIRLYGIPLVNRSDYVVFDRRHLDYLNWIQKFNCLYCSYFNGLMSYAVEVAGRTEKFWCPIKSAMRQKGGHDWEEYFADYGDPKGFMEEFNDTKCFTKLKK